MNDKQSFLCGAIAGISGSCIVILVLLLGLSSAVVWPSSQENVGTGAAENSSVSILSADLLEKLEECQGMLETYYLFEYDEDDLEEGLLKGYMSATGDPYTCYYSKEEMESLQESTEGTYYGIGISMLQNEDGTIQIAQVYHGGDAYAQGVQVGDFIYKVEGESVTGMDLSLVASQVRGSENTTVQVEFYRPSTQEYYTLNLVRKEVQIDIVEYKMLENNIGYLAISSFDSNHLREQMENAIEEMQTQGMEGLIIDLRNNPGGLVTAANEALDLFLPENKVTVSMEDKYKNTKDYKTEDRTALDLPMAVLINGNSASASEIFAGAIQDYGLGTLVGTQSFGKGIVQYVMSLEDGSGVKITAAWYYTPSGVCIHGTGITPDVQVELDEIAYAETGEDSQLAAAIEEVKKIMK
ncbi:MAG: S41 family peptidase [Lachnospiraceae bacterium]